MNRLRGFTLIELLVVIAIAAILTSLAAPSFSRLIQSTALSSDVNTFLADIRFARNEAVKRGTLIVMCKSNAPEAASPNCSAGADWKTGWIIFEDRNDTGTYTSTEPLLRQQSALSSSGGVMDGSGTATLFRFVATGRLRTLSSAARFTFNSTSLTDDASKRVVCINMSGRARIAGDGSVVSCGTDQ
jgi:type IV fimbrial biogenesis protein FimT